MARGRLFLVHWDGAEAALAAAPLEQDGWDVSVESEDGARAVQAILGTPPDAVVVYLARKPSHGRDVMKALRAARAGRAIPLVVVGGDEAAVDKTRKQVRDAEYIAEPSLKRTLSKFATP